MTVTAPEDRTPVPDDTQTPRKGPLTAVAPGAGWLAERHGATRGGSASQQAAPVARRREGR